MIGAGDKGGCRIRRGQRAAGDQNPGQRKQCVHGAWHWGGDERRMGPRGAHLAAGASAGSSSTSRVLASNLSCDLHSLQGMVASLRLPAICGRRVRGCGGLSRGGRMAGEQRRPGQACTRLAPQGHRAHRQDVAFTRQARGGGSRGGGAVGRPGEAAQGRRPALRHHMQPAHGRPPARRLRGSPKYTVFSVLQLGQGALRMRASLNTRPVMEELSTYTTGSRKPHSAMMPIG